MSLHTPLENQVAVEDISKPHVLCPTCHHIVQSSQVLSHHRRLWQRRECFPHFPTGTELNESADRGCHLCTLIASALSGKPYYSRDSMNGLEHIKLEINVARRTNQNLVVMYSLLALAMYPAVVIPLREHIFGPLDVDRVLSWCGFIAVFLILISGTFKHARRYLKQKEISNQSHINIVAADGDLKVTGSLKVMIASPGIRGFAGYRVLNDYWEERLEVPLVTDETAFRCTYNGSKTMLDVAKYWIDTCSADHPKCAVQRGAEFRAPTRLLDVTKFEQNRTARLVLSEDLEDNLRYLTLSYCWGGKSALTLKNLNVEDLRESISLSTVPLTAAQAIEVTYSLGFRYLWVDSLCIIQDSPEDFSKELVLMGEIYRHAYFTIAASSATDCTQGLLSRKSSLQFLPCRISCVDSVEIFIQESASLPTSEDIRSKIIEESPLHRRAWVVQERLLSIRTLHFGLNGLVFWECDTCEAYDGRPHGTAIQSRTWDADPKFGARTLLQTPPDMYVGLSSGRISLPTAERLRDAEYQGLALSPGLTGIAARDFFFFWHILVIYYTRCKMTKITDRLPGITGIMTELQKASEFSIHHGIWHFDSHFCALDLLWAVDSDRGKRIMNGEPTWSWAAVDAGIDYPLDSPSNYYTSEVNILSFRYAHFEAGHLRLRGKLLPFDRADILDLRMNFVGDMGHTELEVEGQECFCLLVAYEESEPTHNCAGLVLIKAKRMSHDDLYDPFGRISLEDCYERIGLWTIRFQTRKQAWWANQPSENGFGFPQNRNIIRTAIEADDRGYGYGLLAKFRNRGVQRITIL